MHSQDCGLRRVDDWRAKQGAENAAIVDCERAAFHVLNGQFVVTGLKIVIECVFFFYKANLDSKFTQHFLNARIAH